ncbi:MAG: hypothetical protein JWM93_2052 [Frankiales bacterium]|nr:hypothetical protein [Frankiales bacterium]
MTPRRAFLALIQLVAVLVLVVIYLLVLSRGQIVHGRLL